MDTPTDSKIEVLESRIILLNGYLNDFFTYSERLTIISGYAGLQGVMSDMQSRKTYDSQFYVRYPYCVATGNLTINTLCPNMQNRNLRYYLDNLSESARSELKIDSIYTINRIVVSQLEDPYSVDITVNITLNISDKFANISANREFTVQVPITGLQDPLYLINGTYNQTIKRSNLTKREGTWNKNDLQQLYSKSEYRVSRDGISFINRMMGNFTPSSLGLQSIVNHTRVVLNNNRSNIDHYYWTGTNFDCRSRSPIMIVVVRTEDLTPGIPTTVPFYLDSRHWANFNLSSPANPTC
jgi:hypothetical protein